MTSQHTRFEIRPVLDAPISTAQLLGHSNIVDNLKKFLESDSMITPLSIAVHGDWGSGKTSLMKTLLSNLDQTKLKILKAKKSQAVFMFETANYAMKAFWRTPTCFDCKRIRCDQRCICDCHWRRK